MMLIEIQKLHYLLHHYFKRVTSVTKARPFFPLGASHEQALYLSILWYNYYGMNFNNFQRRFLSGGDSAVAVEETLEREMADLLLLLQSIVPAEVIEQRRKKFPAGVLE